MIIRITQTVTTDVDVAANDNDTALGMVKGHVGEVVDQQYSEPKFEIVKREE